MEQESISKVKSDYKQIINAWISQVSDLKVKPIFGDVHFSNGIIERIIKKDFTEYSGIKLQKDNSVYNAGGRVITIPNINFHDHIYSRLAKGLNIKGETNSFENILSNLWWKLDKILDKDMIEASAKMAVSESIKNGVTYIFDHHSSPNCISGSLTLLANEIEKNNLRAVLCFESSDRNGKKKSDEAIKENIDFCNQIKNNTNIKSVFGLHASFTLNDDTLSRISEFVNRNDIGIHIHIDEDKADSKISLGKYHAKAIDRLIKYKLLNEKTILAHGVHLSKSDFKKISRFNSAIAVNIESNMNNSVGIHSFKNIPDEIKIVCGTDGMHANPTETIKLIFLELRQQGFSFADTFSKIKNIYFNQIDFARRYFPDFPLLNIGDRADFIVWDYVPPTPLTENNFWGHFIYGMLNRQVQSVFQSGIPLMIDKKLVGIDEQKINLQINKQGTRLFKKFDKQR